MSHDRKEGMNRPLEAAENYYYLLGESFQLNFFGGFEAAGVMDLVLLKQALAQLSDRHPALSCRILSEEQTGAVFRYDPCDFPLYEFQDGSWQQALSELLMQGFDPQTDRSFVRGFLWQGEQSYVFGFVAHHSLADGKPLAALCEELLALMAGESPPLARRQGPLRRDDLLACLSDQQWQFLRQRRPIHEGQKLLSLVPGAARHATRRHQILTLDLDAARLLALRQAARQRGLTVSAVLAAAQIIAIRRCANAGGEATAVLLSNLVDLRQRLPWPVADEAMGVYSSMVPLLIKLNTDGWELAAAYREALQMALERGEDKAFYALQPTPEALLPSRRGISLMRNALRFSPVQFGFSNVGQIQGSQLQALPDASFFFAFNPSPNQDLFSVAGSLNGRLRLLLNFDSDRLPLEQARRVRDELLAELVRMTEA